MTDLTAYLLRSYQYIYKSRSEWRMVVGVGPICLKVSFERLHIVLPRIVFYDNYALSPLLQSWT